MLRIDLRHHHGHIRRPAVGAVVGYHRRLRLRVLLLDLFDLVLRHIHRGEDKINLRRHFRNLVHIFDHNLLYRLRHGRIHLPSVPHCLLVRPARGTGARRNRGHLKPRMVLQKGDKTLPHHTRAA